MFISHTHKFIYLKTEKTASTSIEHFFAKSHGCELQEGVRFSEIWSPDFSWAGMRSNEAQLLYNHMPAVEIRRLFPDLFNAYSRVSSIRNPFTKALSQFYFKNTGKEFLLTGSLYQEELVKTFRAWVQNTREIVASDRNKYIDDEGNYILSKMIRYENLQYDLEFFCKELGVKFSNSDLPWLNKKRTASKPDVKQFFDQSTKEIIEERFGFEFEFFGYSRNLDDIHNAPTGKIF